MDITSVIRRYERELVDSVIPFWEKNCLDRRYGAYLTMLDRDGCCYDTTKYMWMQWRIVYMFAELYNSAYRRNEFLDIAVNGFDFLTAHGKSPDGSYYFALNRQGEPAIAPYNIYSDAFAAMGAAALYKATGEQRCRDEADSAMATYLNRQDNPKGKWEKGLAERRRRLNLGSYMILVNLGNIMADCLHSGKYEETTKSAVETIMDKFLHPELQLIFENIDPDNGFDLESCEGRLINPGHGLETMSFILEYAEKHRREDLLKRACDYIYANYQFGLDREYGGLYYLLDALGKPSLELQWDMKLWWVHNEALVAALYAWRLSGHKKFEQMFMELDAWSWQRFPDPEHGEWFAYLNRRGEPTHMLKGGKWKSFFHLPRCLLNCIKQLQQLEE